MKMKIMCLHVLMMSKSNMKVNTWVNGWRLTGKGSAAAKEGFYDGKCPVTQHVD